MNIALIVALAFFLFGGQQTYKRKRRRISWKKRYYSHLRRKRFRRFRRKSYYRLRSYLARRRFRRYNRFNRYNRYY